MKRTLRLLLIILTVSVYTTLTAQTYKKISLTVNGVSRDMISYAPKIWTKNRPLVISLHGINQDASYQKDKAKWELVADTANFIVVYPNGVNNSWDISGTSDFNFMKAIINKMYSLYSIDTTRVYLNGFSMGAMFTYEAAIKMADTFAAFAPVSGYPLYDANNFASSRAVPIIAVQGMSDDVFTPDDIPPYVEKWAKRDSCNMTPTVISPYYAPYSTKGYYSVATKKTWSDGTNGTEVVLITLTNKGHWYCMDAGVLYTSVEVWNFVKNYSTSGPITADIKMLKTGDTADSHKIISTDYYNMAGQHVMKPVSGVYIVKKTTSEGKTFSQKELVQ